MYKVKKISEIDKKYIRKNKNDQYYSNLIKENWGKLVGDIVAENSFPAFFFFCNQRRTCLFLC